MIPLLTPTQEDELKSYIADLLPIEDCAVLLGISEMQLRLLLDSDTALAEDVRRVAAQSRLAHRQRIRELCEAGSQAAEVELANLRLQFERSLNP